MLVGETDDRTRSHLLDELRAGRITFLFTRDVLSEGLDIPEVNTVLFLRPTESLTVFLQQLGRGLRHAPEKDCLTVLDLVGQVHRRYRLDLKFKALLPTTRFNIEREVEMNFPHLPSGCSLQMDRVAREHVLANMRENLKNLAQQVPERLQTFEQESGQKRIEVKAGAILLDDDPARKLAIQLGLRVIGTAGVLVLAKERELIPAVRPCIDALIENRFFLARAVYDLILKRVREI